MLFDRVPCKECEDRHPCCHGECEKYKSWRKEWDDYKLKDYEERNNARAISDLHFERFQRCTHRKGVK